MLLDGFFPSDIRVEKEARTLLKAGHEVFLLSRGKDGVPGEEIVEGTRVIRVKLPRKLPRRAWNYFWFRAFFVHPFWKNALEKVVQQYAVVIVAGVAVALGYYLMK